MATDAFDAASMRCFAEGGARFANNLAAACGLCWLISPRRRQCRAAPALIYGAIGAYHCHVSKTGRARVSAIDAGSACLRG